MAMHNGTVNGTGWHQAGGDKASATALLVNSIRNSPTQQLVGTSLANQLSAINHQSLSSSPVLQQLTTQQQQQVQVAQQQQQQYGSGISEQNFGGTTYFIPENQKQSHVVYPPYMAYPGVPTDTSVAFMERTTQMKVNARTSFFVGEGREYRQYINNRINESQASLASEDGPTKPFPDVTPQNSNSKESYHGLFPLEQLLEQKSQTLNAQTSTFRATKVEDGLNYCLKRIHGIRNHSMDGYKNLQKWTSIRTANIVSLHTVFTIKAFGDQSIMFVYDFHPAAETLMQRHFMQGFYNKKRQQQNPINEPLIWTYIVQLTAALRALHSKDLAYRQMYPTNILISGKSRLRLNYPAISDILSGNAEDVLRCQQEDLIHLGRVILGLCVNSSQPFQGDQQIIAQCMDMVRKNYSVDLFNLITYLLQPQKRRTVDALMPMIGARFYTQLDSAYLWGDMIEGELEKEVENGRLFRLMCKLGSVNERPHLAGSVSNHDQSWAESGDRFLIRMFRAYLFRQVQDGQSWLELSHIVAALNKLDVGSEEKVMLQSQDEQNVILVTYKDLKKALSKCFNDLYLQNAKDQRGHML